MWLLFLILCGTGAESVERPFVIVVPSYNNKQWFKKNIRSIIQQNYQNYRVIYVNDASLDETAKYVERMAKKLTTSYQVLSFDSCPNEDILTATDAFCELVNKNRKFFTLVNNSNRSGALANIYRAVQSCENHEIIVLVDGDDWLRNETVLSDINALYELGEVWLTHGRFIEYPGGASSWSLKIPEEIIKNNTFRQYRHPSHLRTFYAWLFKNIRLPDLLYEGAFFPMTWDMAIMFPMVEMAGERHAYSDKINYVYNMENQINDNKVDAELQNYFDAYIRNLPIYQRLESENLIDVD